MSKQPNIDQKTATCRETSVAPALLPRHRKGAVTLELPVQEPNIAAIRAFMNECLVPLLAEEFLRRRQRGDEQSVTSQGQAKILDTEPLDQGGSR